MKKYLFSAAAAAVAMMGMAFTGIQESAEETTVSVQYQFTGNNLQDADDPTLWTEVASGSQNCPSGTSLPCTVITDMAIEDWLAGKDPEQIRQQANTRKN